MKTATLTWILYRVHEERRYTTFEIPKKSGGTRQIAAPVPTLRFIQRQLMEVLAEFYIPKRNVHGFVRGKSIVSAAKPHVKAKWVLNVDLADFFPTINFGRVRGLFMAAPFGFGERIATTLAQICCFRGSLPQGAPTSPIVSNLVCRSLDRRLRALARLHKCEYSRFADDITLSTRHQRFPPMLAERSLQSGPSVALIGPSLRDVIAVNGFTVNTKKVRLQSTGARQEVTGLVVNKKVNVPRTFVRQIRAMLHAWEEYGMDAAHEHWAMFHDQKHRASDAPAQFARVVEGKLAFLRMVRGAESGVWLRLKSRHDRLLGKPGLPEAVWVLEGKESQGTGFFINRLGLITNDHVLCDDLFAYQPRDPGKTFKVVVKHRHTHFDLAICGLEGVSKPYGLELSPRNPQIGDHIRVVGFPNHAPGKTHSVASGTIAQIVMHHGAAAFSVDCAIVKGGSGGPVVDTENRVLGIARTGVPTRMKKDHESIAIQVSMLSAVLKHGPDGKELGSVG